VRLSFYYCEHEWSWTSTTSLAAKMGARALSARLVPMVHCVNCGKRNSRHGFRGLCKKELVADTKIGTPHARSLA
jgi:hypothetical protein